MLDIVTRLDRWAIETDSVPASDLMDEAAAEIERLRNCAGSPLSADAGDDAMSDGWISVRKTLPQRGDRVIVAHRQYEWSNASHRRYRLKRLGVEPANYWIKGHMGLQFCRSDGGVVEEPVAWMPMPSPPETTP